jgi:hypothetical protein
MAIFPDYQSLKFTIVGDEKLTRMVSKILFWLYLTNAVLLINHQIDSAFWKECEWLRYYPSFGAVTAVPSERSARL